MLRSLLLISIFGLLLSLSANAQKYAYSFSGTVKDSAELIHNVQNLEWVQKCKLQLKPEKPGGVIIFRIKPYEVTHDKKGNLVNPNPLHKIKSQLFKEGLEPKELIRLKD